MCMTSTTLLPFETWAKYGRCPHCESEYLVLYRSPATFECGECGRFSASFLTDGMEDETEMINRLDREYDEAIPDDEIDSDFFHSLFHTAEAGGE